jgi:hypothetical protein
MKHSVSFKRRLAHSLLRTVYPLLPASRRDWAAAMRAEIDSLQDDGAALQWAIGCLIAGSKERIRTLLGDNLKIPRWILVPEMLLCFLPLTVAWLDALFGGSGIVRLNGAVIETHFLNTPGGLFALLTMICGATIGVLGPLGLLIAFRWVAAGRLPSNRWFRATLVSGPTLYGSLMLVSRVAIGGTGALRFDAVDSFDFWSGFVLLAVLPALGAAHLLRLAPSRENDLHAAR